MDNAQKEARNYSTEVSHRSALVSVENKSQYLESSSLSWSNWNDLEALLFLEGGKPGYSEKNPWSKAKNQEQTRTTYDTGQESNHWLE